MDLLREAGLATAPTLVVHGLYWNDFMSAEPPAPGSPSVLTPGGHFVWDQPAGERGPARQAASWISSRSALVFALKTAAAGVWRGEGSTYQQTYAAMLARTLPPPQAYFNGKVKLGGDMNLAMQLGMAMLPRFS